MKKQTHRILTARLRKMSLLALTCSIGLGACGGENEKANEFDKELAISELKAKESTVERDVVLAYNSKTKENEYFDTATLPSDVVSECYSWQEEFAVDEFADLVVGEEGDYPGTVPANVAMVDGYAIDFEDFHIDAETHEKKLAKKNGKNSPLVAFDNLVEGTKPVKDDFLPGWDDDHGDHWDCLPEQDIFEDYLYKDDVYRIIGFIIFHLADAVLNGDIGNNHPSYPIDWDLPYPDETYPGDWDMPSPTPFPYDDLYPAEEFLGKSCEGIDIAITNEGTLCEKEGLFVYVECFHMSENDYGFEKIHCVSLDQIVQFEEEGTVDDLPPVGDQEPTDPFPYDDLHPAEEFLGKSCEGIDIAITNEATLCEKEGLFVYVECFHMSENDYGFEKIPCVTLDEIEKIEDEIEDEGTVVGPDDDLPPVGDQEEATEPGNPSDPVGEDDAHDEGATDDADGTVVDGNS